MTDPSHLPLLDLPPDLEILLCVGPGGVGKTTCSAAIGLAAARAGSKVLILTIDPARRLADAMGVGIDTEPRRIDPATLAANGLSLAGELWAVMLDPVKTLDDMVTRLAPTRRSAERVLNNLIYRHMSRSMAGTIEYTSVEKLFDLRARYQFDLIVVDTPPSKNLLDFLEAPEWASRFLDERILKWFLLLDPQAPSGGFGASLLRRTSRVVGDVLSRVFGRDFVAAFTDLLHAFDEMAGEFRRRSLAIEALLRSPACRFVVVTTPDDFVTQDAAFLSSEIQRRGIRLGGFVINRVHHASGLRDPEQATVALRSAGASEPDAERLARLVVDTCAVVDGQARRDQAAIMRLREIADWQGLIVTLPRHPGEIHDLATLDRWSKSLDRS